MSPPSGPCDASGLPPAGGAQAFPVLAPVREGLIYRPEVFCRGRNGDFPRGGNAKTACYPRILTQPNKEPGLRTLGRMPRHSGVL